MLLVKTPNRLWDAFSNLRTSSAPVLPFIRLVDFAQALRSLSPGTASTCEGRSMPLVGQYSTFLNSLGSRKDALRHLKAEQFGVLHVVVSSTEGNGTTSICC